jgi:hypothetical protein
MERDRIGIVMSIATFAGIWAQTPAGDSRRISRSFVELPEPTIIPS